MTIRFDANTDATAGVGPGGRPEIPARQARWMLELEKAAFAARQLAAAPGSLPEALAGGRSRTIADKSSAEDLPANGPGGGADATNSANNSGAVAARSAFGRSSGSAPLAGLPLPGTLQQIHTVSRASGPVGAATASLGRSGGIYNAQGETKPNNTSVLPAIPQARSMTAALAWAEFSPHRDENLAQESEHVRREDSGVGQRQQALAAAEDYSSARMQLFQAEDGMHATIRDAALAPYQATLVGAAMADVLAQQGNRLNGLTVNGKAIALPGAGGVARNSLDATSYSPTGQSDILLPAASPNQGALS